MRSFGTADIHIHTIFSDGLMSPEALVEYVLTETTLDVIAVTDHDTIGGARIAQAYVEYFEDTIRPLEIIVGTEVTSADGDILALFVEEDIPTGKTASETVNLIHEQNGLAIAAHPFSHSPILLRIDGMKGVEKLIKSVPFDGVEVRNGTPTEFFSNHIATWRNRQWAKRSETGGSDGHYLPTVGKSHTRFPGKTADDLRKAILNGETSAGGHVYNPFLIFKLIRELITRQIPARHIPDERQSWPLASTTS